MSNTLALPEPRVAVSVREATMGDLPFIDALQRPTTRAVGYFPRGQFEGYVQQNAVLIAEGDGEARPSGSAIAAGDVGSGGVETRAAPVALPHGRASLRTPLGYVIHKDRYLKRDELGVVYQLNVAPAARRHLVGAALLRAAFDRSAYGCKLYCCWCAQDLPANRFWEAMGFVPLAFRAGSRKKSRVHIFWQRRINQGDETTPWWYPFQTTGGAMRADRLAFPIPPGTHWSEVEAVAVPGVDGEEIKALPARKTRVKKAAIEPAKADKVAIFIGGKIRYIARPTNTVPFAPPPVIAPPPETLVEKREKPPTPKIDPRFLDLNRELRDRYLERLNAGPDALPSLGKYDAARSLPGPRGPDASTLRIETRARPALPAAA